MEQEELKRKMMGLWEKSTHNSKELLSLLFDYYFNIDYIEYEEVDGKVVSALCGIPYSFGSGSNILKGLYIIPLTTEEGYRKKGDLSELLGRFNKRMENKFDFSFLVPHTELMTDYFSTQGYFHSFYILEERFTTCHDFHNDYILSLLDSDDRIKELKTALIEELEVTAYGDSNDFSIDKISDFILKNEKTGASSTHICHREKDIEYILQPDSIRSLSCYICHDKQNKITGIAFTQKEEIKRTRVVAVYVDDTCSYYKLLEFIKKRLPDDSLSVNTSDPTYQTHSLIQLTYASSNPAGGDLDNTFGTVEIPLNLNKLLQPLGMVKLLNYENVLKFIAETRSDVDFKLFIRDYKVEGEAENSENKKNIFSIKNGKFSKEPYHEGKLHHNILNLSRKEISELLLRKNDSSNLIMEAFGIPRLNFQIRLLPC